MNIPAKTQYACVAVMELAASYGTDEPVRIRMIANAHGIPSRFLVQILLQLKNAGIVSSTRGAAGGYRLAQDPGQITLAEVMSVIEGPRDSFSSSIANPTPASRVLADAWNEAAAAQHQILENVNFADLLERTQDRAQNMYYI